MSDEGPKSAFELAMERLRQKDKEGGVVERPLTDAQKAAIAEARRVHDAKVAEREILHRDALRKATSHEEATKLGRSWRTIGIAWLATATARSPRSGKGTA